MTAHTQQLHRSSEIRPEAFSSTAQLAAASRLAQVLIVGFETAELADRPLTELQKIDLLATALAAFDGHQADLDAQLELEEALLDAGRRSRERHAEDEHASLGQIFRRPSDQNGGLPKRAAAAW